MRKQQLWVLFLLLSSLLFAACQPTTGFYRGAKADPETITPLKNAIDTEQHWQDLYVSVTYRVEQQGDQLVATGVFTFANYPQLNLARVRDFKLKLFFLNQAGLVVDYLDLYRTLGPSLTETMVFKKTLEISSEVTALSLGYEGSFVDDVGARDIVWKLPKRNF